MNIPLPPAPDLKPDASALDDPQFFQKAIESIPGIVFIIDAKGQLLAWNQNLEQFSGLSAETLRGLKLLEVVHPEDRIHTWKTARTVLRTGRPESLEIRLLRRQQRRTVDFLVMGNRVILNGKNCVIGIALDHSARKLAEKELAIVRRMLLDRNENLRVINQLYDQLQGYRELDSILQTTLETLKGYSRIKIFGIFLYNPETRHLGLAVNCGFDEVMTSGGSLLPSSGSLTGMALAQGSIVLSSDIGLDHRLDPRIRQLLLERHINAAVVIPLLHSSKPLGSINLLFEKSPDLGESELKTLLTIGKTVSTAIANSRQLEDLQHRAYHDHLTGLPNPLVLHEQFGQIADAMEAQGASVALLLVDLLHFQTINETLGNAIGDELLRQIAQRLKSKLSEYGARLFRMEGDEFLVLVPEIAAVEAVTSLAHNLLSSLKKPFEVSSLRLEISANIGITIAPRDGSDSRSLLRCADIALSEAQRQGGGVGIYNRTLDRYSVERHGLVAEIGDAIRNNRFCLHYQPQVDLSTLEIRGFEALVRWQHPRFGLLLPGAFLPLLEVAEAIHRLTHEVLLLGLQEQRRWREKGKDYRLAVNLSARNLQDERCLDDLEKLMRQFDVPAGFLELELTENALASQPPEVLAKWLKRMTGLGIRLAIDGFGAGHSSLLFIRRLPVHTLKIDPYFIQNMTEHQEDAIIVSSTIELAHQLGIQVIAKGVEKSTAQNLLKQMGCDLMQGYSYCSPKAWRDLERWLNG